MNRFRRVAHVLAAGVLAVLGVAVAPTASAQPQPLNYQVKVTGADPMNAQDGDPLRITISGLPAGATANYSVCPLPLRDSLLKPGPWTPNPSVEARVTAYCKNFNDELSGTEFKPPGHDVGRSATTHDVVFDIYVPRGARTPAIIPFDPDFTAFPQGALKWPNNPDHKQYSFSCDENHPCTMMLRIGVPATATSPAQTVFDSSITFRASAPGLKIKGCAGVGASTLTGSMPERFGRTAVGWNQMLCAPTKAAQPVNIVNESEDVGLTSFDKGESDVQVTGSGGTLATQQVRARSYIPAALNATVLAAVGWAPTDRRDDGGALNSRLADNLKFDWDDLANLLSKGGLSPDSTGRGGIFVDGSALVRRNPALAAVSGAENALRSPNTRAGQFTTDFFGVTGEIGTSTVPLVLSSRLNGMPAWTYGTFVDIRNAKLRGSDGPVGVVTDLNALNLGDGGVHNVDAKTGQVNVRKQVVNAALGTGNECTNGCLNWVVTDLATATENGWAPVALPNGKGGYVAPTPKSLQAAAAHAQPAEDGSIRIVPGGDPEAYPLTYVESLTAPLNPLVDASCQPQAAKQAQLATFVKAAVSGGQDSLGPGLVPLTPELLSAAQTAAAKVGTGTAEASCHEHKEAQNPGAAATGGPGAAVGGTPASDGLGGPLARSGSNGPGAAEAAALAMKAPTQASVQEARSVAAAVKVPLFPGADVLGALIPLLALVALVLLPPTTGYLTAGKPLPAWLNRLAERLVAMRRRA
ncbi:hypothetical protein CU254_24075 [Amycolatopsis sp. AA4]|uniref:hypothetical protein n=1 Tax=Actinomycetes TaxID=1760 RepID=UPI0001B565F3|nr:MULTISPECIES: hypothetical protein [Actinomycetes]ATY13171.1 hypothetical protein CU254_24075 [Amycolatopsis sp. AA4]EFL09072.1 predicted protein [Streptomyces sp. AA4]